MDNQVTTLTIGPFSVDVRGMTAHDAKACFRVLVLTFPNSQGHVLDDETEAAIAKADALLDSHGVAPVPTFQRERHHAENQGA